MLVGVDHVGIAVRSLEQAIAFYQSLGMVLEAQGEVPHEGVFVAFLACGPTKIELVAPASSDSSLGRFLDTHGPGLHHICLRSTDLAADDARLRGAGCRLVRNEPTDAGDGCLTQFIHPRSSGGVLIELQQAIVPDGAP